jgi:hypothetical protein
METNLGGEAPAWPETFNETTDVGEIPGRARNHAPCRAAGLLCRQSPGFRDAPVDGPDSTRDTENRGSASVLV